MAPSSIVPNSWRYICGFTAACFLAGVEPSVTLFRAVFTLGHHPKLNGWCYVTPRKVQGRQPLIRGAPTAVHGWKERFLFVSRASGEGWGLSQWGEPPKGALLKPKLGKDEEEGLATLFSHSIPVLDELLSEQMLFNVGISPSCPQAEHPVSTEPSGRGKKRKAEVGGSDNESRKRASVAIEVADVSRGEDERSPVCRSPPAADPPATLPMLTEPVRATVGAPGGSAEPEGFGPSSEALGNPDDDPAAPSSSLRDLASPSVKALSSSPGSASDWGELRSMYETFEELLHYPNPSGSQQSAPDCRKRKPHSSFLRLSRSIHGLLKYAVDSHTRIWKVKGEGASQARARKAAEKKLALEAEAREKAEARASKAEAEAASEREKAELELAGARAVAEKSNEEARAAREEASRLESELAAEKVKSSVLGDQQQEQLTAAAGNAVAAYRNLEGFRDDLTTYSAEAFLAGKDEVFGRLRAKCPDFDFSLLDSSDSEEEADLPASGSEAPKE